MYKRQLRTGHTLGEAGAEAEVGARELQDLLGEIHDCDTLLPRVEAMRAALLSQDASALAELAEGDAERVPGLVERAPNAVSYRGLATLAAAVQARRELLYARFIERWDGLLAEGFRVRLTEATTAARGG